MSMIGEEPVRKIFHECHASDEEGKTTDACRNVQGLVNKATFSMQKLEANRGKIIDLLHQLPAEFSFQVGSSFRRAIKDRAGVQWTEYHAYAEMLVMLGMAIGAVEILDPMDGVRGGSPQLRVLV